MKALVKTAPGKGNLAICDIPEPQPRPGWVKIAVEACGVCGSDLHIYHDDMQLTVRPPVVIGHELAGVIAEVGEGVAGWQVGDRVTTITSAVVCGQCRPCREGRNNLCTGREIIGFAFDGGFARYTQTPAHCLRRVPDTVTLRQAALTEPLACAVHAVSGLTGVSAGDLVVVTGPGAVGLLAAQVAMAEGGRVVVCGAAGDEKRLAVARDIGLDRALHVTEDDVPAIIHEMSNGEGADVFLECAGAPAAARMGFEVTRRGGKFTQVGLFSRPFELDFGAVAYKELQIVGSMSQHPTDWDRALLLMAAGQVQTEPLIGETLPITEWERAFELFAGRQTGKILLTPA